MDSRDSPNAENPEPAVRSPAMTNDTAEAVLFFVGMAVLLVCLVVTFIRSTK
jgi:hypothetical protein